MIKPIELTPGSTVLVKGLGVVEVVAIWKSVVRVSNNFFDEEYFNFKEIRPIPITPEIAKKLGFRKKRGASHMWEYYQKGAIEIWFKNKRADSVWWNTTILLTHQKRISVHRLQRALEEKTRIRIDFSKLLK